MVAKARTPLGRAPTEALVIVDPNGNICSWDRAAEKVFGYTAADIVGRPVTTIIPERFGDKRMRGFERFAQAGKRPTEEAFDWYGLRRDGSEVPIGLVLAPLRADDNYVTAIVRPSDVLRREPQLEPPTSAPRPQTDSLMSRLLDAITVGVLVLDADGRMHYANEAASKLGSGGTLQAGIGFEDLVRRHPTYRSGTTDRYPVDQMPIMRALRGEVCEAEEMEVRGDLRGTMQLLVSASPMVDSRGNVEYAIATFQDVTAQRRLEAQARQSQKMEAVGRLAGGIAHDFNNLLTAILSFAGFVAEELREEEQAYEDLQQVLKAGRRAADLTRQLLTFSRKQVGTVGAHDPNVLIEDVQPMLRRLLGEQVEVVYEPTEDVWPVCIDSGEFEQLLVNLAVNGRDAMPSGGQLTIESQNVTLETECPIVPGAAVPPGDFVVVAVSDTGVGMSRETQALIFEPFFTTKKAGEGTGLGLATCYGIVRQAGGHISVYSEVGRGTTFKLYFPRAAEQRPQATLEVDTPPQQGTETVLVAEDDEQVRRLAVRSLRKQGYQVLAAENAGTALLHCEQHPEIALLVTDVVMPLMDGSTLARRVARVLPQIKVLYMSGYTPKAILHQGIELSGPGFLQKPFTPALLASRVRRILDEPGHLAAETAPRDRALVIGCDPDTLGVLRDTLGETAELVLSDRWREVDRCLFAVVDLDALGDGPQKKELIATAAALGAVFLAEDPSVVTSSPGWDRCQPILRKPVTGAELTAVIEGVVRARAKDD